MTDTKSIQDLVNDRLNKGLRNVWHPVVPFMWQGNSVLFEVGMCVMVYLNVLYIEFVPVVTERFILVIIARIKVMKILAI